VWNHCEFQACHGKAMTSLNEEMYGHKW